MGDPFDITYLSKPSARKDQNISLLKKMGLKLDKLSVQKIKKMNSYNHFTFSEIGIKIGLVIRTEN